MRITIGGLELVEFSPVDSRELYRIRNHASVREGMLNPELIPYRAHKTWVQQHLIDKHSLVLFMVRQKGKKRAIGFTQLHLDGETGEIGVMFREPSKHYRSVATATVATIYLGFCYLKLRWIDSYVIPDHKKALRFNRSWGTAEVLSDKPGLLKFRAVADIVLNNPAYLKTFQRIEAKIKICGHLKHTNQ